MVLLTNIICQQIKRIPAHILVCVLAFFFPAHRAFADGDPNSRDRVRVVVIDPGHGGMDPGALGSHFREKDVVLAVALKLGGYIEENYKDVKVIYTRKSDIFIPLHERADIANRNKADLFISIHANSLPGSLASGTETFVMGEYKNNSNLEVAKKENAVITLEDDYSTKYEGFDPNSDDSYIVFSLIQKTYLIQSLDFAGFVQEQFREKARRIDRGVKMAGFVVLWKTTMPSVLIETGFLTSSKEEAFLGSSEGQDYLASAIFRAFRSYKERIENNSHFEAVVRDKPSTDTKLSDTKIQDSLSTAEVKNEHYFKVQVLSSRNTLDETDPYFNGFSDVEAFHSGKWIKYAVGRSVSYSDIILYCNEVKKTYPDAFVVAVRNGEIISLNEALQYINK